MDKLVYKAIAWCSGSWWKWIIVGSLGIVLIVPLSFLLLRKQTSKLAEYNNAYEVMKMLDDSREREDKVINKLEKEEKRKVSSLEEEKRLKLLLSEKQEEIDSGTTPSTPEQIKKEIEEMLSDFGDNDD